MITPESMIAALFLMHTSLINIPSADVINFKEIKCLADNIYFESSGQPGIGQRGVAHVTLNRANRADFPSTVCKTVWQKRCAKKGKSRRGYAHRGCTAQFTWTWDGKPDKIYLYSKKRGFNDKVYGEYLIAASEAVMAILGVSKDPTFGATHYYNPDVCYKYRGKTLKTIVRKGKQCHPKWAKLKRFKKTIKIGPHQFIRMDLPKKRKK